MGRNGNAVPDMGGGHMSESLYDFCRKYDRQYLLEEWDSEKNLPLTPDGVTHGSHTMAWWRCGSGHSWQALVYTRTAGSGCPYCAGKKLGQSNDFASLYPDLAVQWDTRKMPRESRLNSRREATTLRGGFVRKDTPGGPRSIPGSPAAAAARSALAGWCSPARTIWPLSSHGW